MSRPEFIVANNEHDMESSYRQVGASSAGSTLANDLQQKRRYNYDF